MNRREFIKSLVFTGTALKAVPKNQHRAWGRPVPTKTLDSASAMRLLSEHRIAGMETRRVQNRYPRFIGRNAFGKPAGHGGLRKIRIIRTDQGATGWSQSWWPEERVQPFVGARLCDLFDIDSGTAEAAEPLDQPLYDLVGNILKLPVYELLGAKGSRTIPIYSGAIYFDDLEPPDRPRGITGVLASCRQDYDVGYRAFKLKIGRGFKWMSPKQGIQRDIDVTREVREQFPDCKILVDANNGYTLSDFLDYISAIADCDLYWIEEPFHENREGLVRLRDHMAKVGCKALIAEGESQKEQGESLPHYGHYSRKHIETLLKLGREKLVDVLLLDLNTVGFTRWRRIMPKLEEAGILASPHTWASSLRSYYTAQLAAGVGNIVIVEGIPGEVQNVDLSGYPIVDGNIAVPDAPGFGLALTR